MNPDDFSSSLAAIMHENICVIDAIIPKSSYIPINLSGSNTDLETFDIGSSEAWEVYITNFLKTHHKKVAFGGYLEKRGIYNRSDYFNNQNPETERNIHLGLDLWTNAGTAVLAAFDGTIHSFKDNTNFGDYGPTIILKHAINTIEFYTLYGHLSRESIAGLQVGTVLKQGETLGYLGEAEVNGDYAPHLHFQIIKDLQGNSGDYPGVSSSGDLEFYKDNCPNPEIVLGLEW